MSPRRIAEEAVAKGIEMIAVTDHNSARMVDAVAGAATAAGLEFLFGMELQTREEVHLLAYFDEAAACHRFADAIYDLLPDRPNEPAYFGDQVVVDVDEEILGQEPRLLVNSLDLAFDEAVSLVREHGGLPVPAHVDREPYGLVAQLGFPPKSVAFDLVETIGGTLPGGFGRAVAICSSDAHRPEEIGRRRTLFEMNEATTEEMILAAQRVGGRSVTCVAEGWRGK